MSSVVLTTADGEKITFHSPSELSSYALEKSRSREGPVFPAQPPMPKQLRREKFEMAWENAVKKGKAQTPEGWTLERV